MRFFELLATLPDVATADRDVDITAPVTDSAQDVAPGGVFVARRGATVDGHDLIPVAVERGAAAVVGERAPEQAACPVPYAAVPDARAVLAPLAAAYFGFPSRQMIVIGVTGTDGKTTTVSLIHNILREAGIRAGMISTVSAIIDDAALETGLHVTTPRAPDVQGYLARMVDAGLTHCVLETTSHGLAQGRVDAIDFDVAVITNIQHEHLDYHGSWEAYRDAKALLFRKLMQSAPKPGQDKVAVINLDDAPSADYLRAIPADRHLTYALEPTQAEFVAERIRYRADGTHFSLRGQEFISPLVGDYNVSNVLAAVAAAHAVGVPLAEARRGVASLPQIPGRMERIDEGQDFLAVVDFAHTPNSLRQVLTTARRLIAPDRRVICVVGSAGLRDREKRRMMAEIAAELADFTILTAEDPRTESLEQILEAMAAGCVARGGVEGQTFMRVPDRGRALFEAVQRAQRGDIVLACGKGHEQSMCFGETEYPWDDREALRAALRGAPLLTLPTAHPA
ncbi:MAG: UDP-N-acetylmuramoyl-L-alanyl-D-glutamate--2,6-diaminopimelate ligase [Anaerolineae bacterium]